MGTPARAVGGRPRQGGAELPNAVFHVPSVRGVADFKIILPDDGLRLSGVNGTEQLQCLYKFVT